MTQLSHPRLVPLSLLAGALAVAGCDASNATVETSVATQQAAYVEIAGGNSCVTLYAGQTIDAGTVCMSIDNAVDTSAVCGAGATGAIEVAFTTTGGWEIAEAHLALGDELADFPVNRKGNPQIGLFPYATGDITGATSHTFQVPLCVVGLDGADEACDPVTAYVAAHAAVRKANGDGTFQTETGWGDGDRFVAKGSWAEYFNASLECKVDNVEPPAPVTRTCETAFAWGDEDATCFLDLDFDADGRSDFSRWGWTNGPLGPGSYAFDIYQAAGRCDLSKGDLVGTLGMTYDGATAQVTYETLPGFVMDETHLYVGSAPLASNNGEYTVAPGQYGQLHDLGDATSDSFTVTGLSGDIYVVAHAVTCAE